MVRILASETQMAKLHWMLQNLHANLFSMVCSSVFILAITKKISNIREMLSTSDSLLIAFEYHEFATLEAFPHIIYLFIY
jgi:hypothetical protein